MGDGGVRKRLLGASFGEAALMQAGYGELRREEGRARGRMGVTVAVR